MIDALVSVLYVWAKNVALERMQNFVAIVVGVGTRVGCFFYFIDTIHEKNNSFQFFFQSRNACMPLNEYLIGSKCIFSSLRVVFSAFVFFVFYQHPLLSFLFDV